MFGLDDIRKRSARLATKTPTSNNASEVEETDDSLSHISTEKFDLHYDDSSDEEDIDEKIDSYPIAKKWEKIQKQHGGSSRNGLNNDELLSFVVHAAGLHLLYSKEVNQRYYVEKQRVLNNTHHDYAATHQLQALVLKQISLSLTEALQSIQPFLTMNGNVVTEKPVIATMSESITLEFNKKIQGLIQENLNLFILFIQKNQYWSEIEFIPAVNRFIKEITDFLTVTFLNACTVKSTTDKRSKYKIELLQLANKRIDELYVLFKLDIKVNLEGKNQAILLLANYQGKFKHLAHYIKSLLEFSSARGYVQNIISKQMEDELTKNSILNAFIIDLLSATNLSKNEDDTLKKFFSYKKEFICDEVSTNFSLKLHANLQNIIKSFYRPVLGKNFLFASNNPYSFYANIRLSNRSQKRQILNLQHAVFKQDQVARSWRLSDTSSNDTDVNEHQEILGGSFGRRDIVDGLSNYEKISSSLTELKDHLDQMNIPVSDKELALWMRSVFNGTMPELNLSKIDTIVVFHKLQSITYLLFGCETTRNPAMAIVNQMILDLIIHGNDMSFEEALTGETFMPMMPEGAVAAARSLESRFRKFLPYPYRYRGAEDTSTNESTYGKDDLIKSEAAIVRAWLSLQTDFTPTQKQPFVESLFSFINDYAKNWIKISPLSQLQGIKNALR